MLRVAVKPSADARTGIVAHVDVLYLLEKAKAFGKHAVSWVEKLAARIKTGAVDFVKMLAGKLHFELPEMPGTFFDFDLKLQLPHLFRGGSFDWASLLPSGFHIDLGNISLGALPRSTSRATCRSASASTSASWCPTSATSRSASSCTSRRCSRSSTTPASGCSGR